MTIIKSERMRGPDVILQHANGTEKLTPARWRVWQSAPTQSPHSVICTLTIYGERTQGFFQALGCKTVRDGRTYQVHIEPMQGEITRPMRGGARYPTKGTVARSLDDGPAEIRNLNIVGPKPGALLP